MQLGTDAHAERIVVVSPGPVAPVCPMPAVWRPPALGYLRDPLRSPPPRALPLRPAGMDGHGAQRPAWQLRHRRRWL